MPNWCHCTLTVAGNDEHLARFVEQVREDVSDERLRSDYADIDRFGPPDEDYDAYAARRRANRAPLSFDAIFPYRTEEWEDTYRTCPLCSGTGKRPDGEARFGREWVEWCGGCNGCHGTGRALEDPGWYRHHIEMWGCKWDARFGGGFMALTSSETADLDLSAATLGATITPTVAVYKFETPWSPPSEFVRRASELFADLEFRLQYGEPGGGYAGRESYVAGVLVHEEELELDEVLAPEEMWF